MPLSPRCTHIKGNVGAKAAVRRVMARLGDNLPPHLGGDTWPNCIVIYIVVVLFL
jgi:hypothetical protein